MSEQTPAEEPVLGDGPPNVHVLFSNKVYGQVKILAQYVLPAVAVFYLTLAPLWGLPKQEEVAGTIVAIDLLLGALLGISNTQYKNSEARFDGAITLTPDENREFSDMRVNIDPNALMGKNELTVKVNKV